MTHIPQYCPECHAEMDPDGEARDLCDACHFEWIERAHPELAVEVATAETTRPSWSKPATWTPEQLERLLADVRRCV